MKKNIYKKRLQKFYTIYFITIILNMLLLAIIPALWLVQYKMSKLQLVFCLILWVFTMFLMRIDEIIQNKKIK